MPKTQKKWPSTVIPVSCTGHFDVHLSEEKSFMVIGKYFFFQILLHLLDKPSEKSPNYSELQIFIRKLLAFAPDCIEPVRIAFMCRLGFRSESSIQIGAS